MQPLSAPFRFATRPSALARWQTQHVIEQLQAHWPDITCEEYLITTQGDRVLDVALPEIGGKGLFTLELEEALRKGRVQAAVHSLKDLPTEESPALMIGAILPRADARDVLIQPDGLSLDQLPSGAVVGTSSTRRIAQLLAHRPDLQIEPMRGNIDTRIRKVRAGAYHAIILAAAGVTRLGLQAHISQYLPFEIVLPAPGQGALAVQCRADDQLTSKHLRAIDHSETRLCVAAERAFLSALGGGCSLPVAALARMDGVTIHLEARVLAPDGSRTLRLDASDSDPLVLGQHLAEEAFDQGAGELLNSMIAGGR
jgi:hydroxymethylbilane synthase